MKKYQREIKRSMEVLKAHTPAFKLRTERETEELLHKYRVIARKRQIALVKLDAEIPFQPWNILTYTEPKRRREFFKILVMYLSMLRP